MNFFVIQYVDFASINILDNGKSLKYSKKYEKMRNFFDFFVDMKYLNIYNDKAVALLISISQRQQNLENFIV